MQTEQEKSVIDNQQHARQQTRQMWAKSATFSSASAGVFSVIILILLVVNFLQIKVYDPVREERLEMMKLTLSNKPNDMQLLEQIRQTDLEIRADRLKRQAFSRRGAVLLFAGLVVLVFSLKLANDLKKQPHLPEKAHSQKDINELYAHRTRFAVAAGFVGVLIFVLVIAFAGRIRDYSSAFIRTAEEDANSVVQGTWARFRGPGGAGISRYENIVQDVNVSTGKNIIWKTEIPLSGMNSPVVCEGKVFVTGGNENTTQVYCFDASGGTLLWTGVVPRVTGVDYEKFEMPEDTGIAAPTAVVNEHGVYAIFANGDMAGFDHSGEILWNINLGLPDSTYGYASSLDVYKDMVLVQYDQGESEDDKSKLIAIDCKTGNIVWQTVRPVPGTWTSPIVIEHQGVEQIITAGDPWVIAYNPSDGSELWRVDCLGTDVAPSPIYAGGLVFGIEPYTELVAIKPDGSGDITKTHIAWTAEDGIPDICSPVSDGQRIYLLTTDGTFTCYKVSDGAKVYEEDLSLDIQASPSLVGDKLFLLSERGMMIVIQAGDEYKEVARSDLGEYCYASPAFIDGRMYIRAKKNLYCIGSD